MKYFFSLLIVIFALPAFGQDTTYYDKNRNATLYPDSISYYEVLEKDKADSNQATLKSYYKSGQIKSEIHYSSGKINGLLMTWWENGTLKRKDEFQNGICFKGTCYNAEGKEIPYFDYKIKPQYPGGTEALLKYIQIGSKKNKWDHSEAAGGELIVKFVVRSDGKPDDVWVQKGISKEIDEQAKKLIYDMPKWKPGQQDGEVIAVRYNLPIRIINID